jgi:hypothetical protein
VSSAPGFSLEMELQVHSNPVIRGAVAAAVNALILPSQYYKALLGCLSSDQYQQHTVQLPGSIYTGIDPTKVTLELSKTNSKGSAVCLGVEQLGTWCCSWWLRVYCATVEDWDWS